MRDPQYLCFFATEIGEFQSLVGSFIGMVDGLAQEVEREKMKAIGARNLLKSIARERESRKQQLHALLVEKRMELERCDTHTPSQSHVCTCGYHSIGYVSNMSLYNKWSRTN